MSLLSNRFSTFLLSKLTKSFNFKHSAKSLLTSTKDSKTDLSSWAVKQSLTASPKLIAPHSLS